MQPLNINSFVLSRFRRELRPLLALTGPQIGRLRQPIFTHVCTSEQLFRDLTSLIWICATTYIRWVGKAEHMDIIITTSTICYPLTRHNPLFTFPFEADPLPSEILRQIMVNSL